MAYNPATDFFGLWRASGPNVVKMEAPGLDMVIAALARAGIINLTVSATAPVANQSTTAWLRAATPSWSAEGSFFLWDKLTTAYLAATPALFFQFLEASAGEASVSWWTSTGGAPLNTVGSNGDFAIRLDTPYGIYGPKAAGAWPTTPIPGTADVITSASLDNTFGASRGNMLARGVANWAALPIGAANSLLSTDGNDPLWVALAALMDSVFSNTRGSVLYRGAGGWAALGPGAAGQVFATGGPGADPSWTPKTPEFASGTVLLFYQATAPVGWTKQTAIDDYGLRIVSGAGGVVHPGNAFSTVFAQTVTGGHALTAAENGPHQHSTNEPIGTSTTPGGGFAVSSAPGATLTGVSGAGTAHTHPINLTLAYADVIIASKD